MTDRPNFVFIMCDQQTRDHLGCYGAGPARTPNIDRLAASGMRFDTAYTACPLCCPARASVFTGLLPEKAGPWCNGPSLFADVEHMGGYFRRAGYRCAYTGKWHLDGAGYWGAGVAPEGFEAEWWYDGRRYANDLGAEEFSRYTQTGSMAKIAERGIENGYCWGTRVTDRALSFLETVEEEPFLLVVSYDEPHPPLVFPADMLETFDRDRLPLPETLHETHENKPGVQARWSAQMKTQWNLCEETLAEGIEHVYTCNTYIDGQIGRVLDAVDDRFAENTVVVYTTDHGDAYGAHGLLGKGPAMYDEIAAAPLLVRAPGVAAPGSSTAAPASNMDVLPTMLDLAGVDVPKKMDGVSLASDLGGGPAAREHVCVSFTKYDLMSSRAFDGYYPVRCIRDERYKLSINVFETDELYDMEEDPSETTNRIDDPALSETRDCLHDALCEDLANHGDMLSGLHVRRRPWRKDA